MGKKLLKQLDELVISLNFKKNFKLFIVKYKTDDFFKARIKLTCIYQVIIILIITFFSFIIYFQINNTITNFNGSKKVLSQNTIKKVLNKINPNINILNIEKEKLGKLWRYNIILDGGKEIKVNPITGNYYIDKDNLVNINEVLDNINQDIVQFLIVVNIIIIFLSIILSYFLAGKTLKPIRKKINEQNQFIADISHELRNPLSAIKLTADSMIGEKMYNINYTKDVFKDISSETKRLIKMSEGLLNIIKGKDNKEKNDVINISKLVSDNIKIFFTEIKEKNIKINLEIKENIIFKGNENDFIRVIFNILDNAIKFSYKNGKINIKINNNKIIIKDYGIGINKKDIGKIFNRFYKIDTSRTFNYNGTGLGLSIVKNILNKYNFDIKVKSQINKGTEFIIIFI